MQLTIQHLSLAKRNSEQVLVLAEENINWSDLPKEALCENDQISFHLILESAVDNIFLIIGDREYRYTRSELVGSSVRYSWIPDTFRNGHKAFFHNFFGIASVAIKIDEQPLFRFRSIEVFSEKVTADRCEDMLAYLASEKNIELLNELSPTAYSLQMVESGISAGKLLEHIYKTVKDLELYVQAIIKRPLTKVRGNLSLVDGKLFESIDEQSIGWVLENASVVSEAVSKEESHFTYDDDWYFVEEVQANLLSDSTEIYENKMLHFFVKKIYESCEQFKQDLISAYRPQDGRSSAPSGFVSFFEVMNRTLGKNKDIKLERINDAIKTIGRISHYLKSHVPCKNISLNKIHLTERIKKDRNYFGFFKVVKSWQIDKEVDWRPERLLININSADKLFEVYCCASINSYLYRVGKPSAIKKGLFDGVVLNHQINLKYEPIFWKAGHRNSINQPYLNTDMDYKYASQSQRSSESGKYLNRRPDYVIEFMNLDSGEKKLIILDAKYMKPEIASDQLAPLVMKYVHGIHASSGENVVDGLLILHPENLIEKNSTGKYIDHHAYPYDLYSGKAVRPILGLQSIVLSRDGVEQKLFETLDLIFSILVHDSKLRAVV